MFYSIFLGSLITTVFSVAAEPLVVPAVNVKAFGAVGDGRTDDTIAIQAALASLTSHVFVPGGTYNLTRPLRIPSNKRLTLAPNATMLRKSNASAMLLNDADGLTGGYSASSNIIVEGGVWNGNAADYPEACTILAFGHAANITVRDCSILNTPGWHAVELNATRGARIERLYINGCSNEAVQLDTMNSASRGVFPWFGPYDDTGCRDILVQECIFDNVLTALGSHSAPAGENVLFRNCVVNGSFGTAVSPNGYSVLTIEGCQFNGCMAVYRGAARGLEFRDNEILDSVAGDINLASCPDAVVTGNTIVNARTGITNSPSTAIVSANRLIVATGTPPSVISATYLHQFSYDRGGSSDGGEEGAQSSPSYQLVASDREFTTTMTRGGNLNLSVVAAGTPPLAYQWFKDGNPISGATSRSYNFDSGAALPVGRFEVRISNSLGTVKSAPIRMTLPDDLVSSRTAVLSNISVRSQLERNTTLAMGYTIAHASRRKVLTRGIGPTLHLFGIQSPTETIELECFNDTGTIIARASGWEPSLAALFTTVGAFPLPSGSRDAALAFSLPKTQGTARIRGGGTGDALMEVYDTEPLPAGGFVNMSARAMVGGEKMLIAGFNIGGEGEMRVLVRAIGPSLAMFGIDSPQMQPRLELYDSGGHLIAASETWSVGLAQVFRETGSFPLAEGSGDAAFLVTLRAAKSYTAIMRGMTVVPGEALFELYTIAVAESARLSDLLPDVR